MNDRPEPPPEGRLISHAAGTLGLSIREAARRAGISYGRWRQIVTGYQNISPGVTAPVHAPAATVARMARVVGVTPERLETEGRRADAAEILREMLRGEPPRPAPVPPPAEPGEPDDTAWRLFPTSPEKRALWRLTDGDGRLLSEKIRAELVAAFDQAVSEAARDEEDNGERGRRAAG